MFSRHVKEKVKTGLFRTLVSGGLDRYFRSKYRGKLLVVMYHGITKSCYGSAVWSQLPVEVFRSQLEFLLQHYQVVALKDVVAAIGGQCALPERAALITFDDGFKNTYTVAFPVLRELGLPATVFLTVDLIGTSDLLWFDELRVLVTRGAQLKVSLPFPEAKSRDLYLRGFLDDCCLVLAEYLKLAGRQERGLLMAEFRRFAPIDKDTCPNDFRLLDWDEVRAMQQSGLVEFGVHTASHCILSELRENELDEEVHASKLKLEEMLQEKVASFCFPNGRPDIDYQPRHLEYLRSVGFSCAFSTANALFSPGGSDCMAIGRIPAGNDFSSDAWYFRLNTSGAVEFGKKLLGTR